MTAEKSMILGDAEMRVIASEAFSLGGLAAQVSHIAKQMEERKQDETLWRARLEPLLAERSGDREKIERIRTDLNGLGDKVRKQTEAIEKLERERNEQVAKLERDRAEEVMRSGEKQQQLERKFELELEKLRSDFKRALAFGSGALFVLGGFWALFGDAIKAGLHLGGN